MSPRHELRRLVRRAREEYRRGGLRWTLSETLLVAQSYAACSLLPACRNPGSFRVGEHELTYVRRPYNHAWRNERCVELAIARAFVDAHPGRVLEVGNVLQYYFFTEHAVVDRYEEAPGIHNVDVVDWCPEDRYDAIVAVSTLEHVGYDEDPQEPDKGLRAIAHLRSLLVPGSGRLLVTVPLGHNPILDSAIANRELDPTAQSFFRRAQGIDWEETDAATALSLRYDIASRSARAIFVGVWASSATEGDDERTKVPLEAELTPTGD